jgi:Glycosyltransferase family 87
MKSIILCFLAIAACGCFYLLKGEKTKMKTLIWSAYGVLFLVAAYLFLSSVIYNYRHPHIWDFSAFYLYGKVAAGGYNYYVPENFHLVFNSLHLPFSDTGAFVEEVVNVGFPYPPPTMLYFAPLGFLSYSTALTLWTVFILLFLGGSICLTYSLFFKEYKLNGLILVATLFFLFLPVRETIVFSQTNFLLLFYLLLIKKYANTKYAGIVLALAIFTKPYMIVFIMFFILRKNWKAILYFAVSCAAFVGITAALFGTAPFMSYIFNNAANRLPAWVFAESINQSLHAVLLRAHLISVEKPLVFACIAGGLLLGTLIYLLFLVKRKLYDFILPVLLLIGLILYPGTLSYYGVLLLFIMFQFFDEKKQLGFSPYISIALAGVVYCLICYSVFASFCFLLGVLMVKSVMPPAREQRRDKPRMFVA